MIASRNEGDLLWKTVGSCRETAAYLKPEIVVADDASEDESMEVFHRVFPGVRIISDQSVTGVSPTKDLGIRAATGDVIVFLDAHCKPEPRAIEYLIRDVEA